MAEIKTKIAESDYLFEISWEVCNKVGGIYTVLSSKASQMLNFYRQNYYLIGPYFPAGLEGCFEEEMPSKDFNDIFIDLEREGIKCHFGKWLINGQPKVILIDFKDFWPKVNRIKTELWEDYKIDSLEAGGDFDEPVVWSYAAGILIERAANLFKGKKIVAHFHEWLSGSGLLYLKKKKVILGTVFTTHATVLGRVLAYHNVDLYSVVHKIEPEKEAVKYHILAKHQMEKQSAKNCDVFTTVSEITGLEAGRFLERKPDFLLPNGLDLEKFLSIEEIINKHRIQRERLKEFSIFYFFPYYGFDLENVLFYFIAGRYEFRSKGIDIFIKALAKLNQKLIENKSRKTIISFFWIPAGVKGIKTELLENRENFRDIKDSLEEISDKTDSRILYTIIGGRRISDKVLFEKDFLFEIKKKLLRFKRKGLPPIATHDLVDEKDAILRAFQEACLTNKKSDRVKVVFYPIYLTGHDGLSNLNCQEGIQACHLGVFPSFYEPWGYTPLETAALGVASVTTDSAGFGRYCQKMGKEKKYPGLFVLEGLNRDDEQKINSLSDVLYRFSQLSRPERAENKIQARKIAAKTEWKIFVKNYIEAHNLAISKL